MVHERELRGHVDMMGRRACTVAVAAYVIVATSACSSEPVRSPPFDLAPFASVPAPLSYNNNISLANEDVACVIDSFEVRVGCVDAAGEAVGQFGREGEGPGEFKLPDELARGPNGVVGVFDGALLRMTVFDLSGTVEFQTRLPPLFIPARSFGATVPGYLMVPPPPPIPGEPMPDLRLEISAALAEIEIGTGRIGTVRESLDSLGYLGCRLPNAGSPTPWGGWVLQGCNGDLMFLRGRGAEHARVVASPAYAEEFPNERDVAAYLEDLARFGALTGGNALPESAMAGYASAFRERPKRWFRGTDALAFDGHGRLWVATNRDRDIYSYFDVWTDTVYAGTIRLRDRLMGYDVLGSTLVALVERAPGPEGVAKRAIDWYRIEDLW